MQKLHIKYIYDLENLEVDSETDRILLSWAPAYIGEDPNIGYTPESEGFWKCIVKVMNSLGWEWNGSAGVEEEKGEWFIFSRIAP
jgi:hypothetical protein